MSGLKESRKKIQRSIEFLAQHAEVNRSAALHELLQVSKTLVACLNKVNDPEADKFQTLPRFMLVDYDEESINATPSNAPPIEVEKCQCRNQREDTTYGEQFRQAVAEAQPVFVSEEQVNNYFAQEAAELAEEQL